jgi:hypothetical protein
MVAAPKPRRTKSTARVIATTKARELADLWGLLGEDRDAVVSFLPRVTEYRRTVETELNALPSTRQLRAKHRILEKRLKAIRTSVGEVLSADDDGRVAEWIRELDELILPLVQAQLRDLDHDIATGRGSLGSRARPQDLKLAESVVDFHAARLSHTKLSRQRFARDVLAEAGVAEGSIESLINGAAANEPQN